ncbi:hypothetical protein IJT93_00925 [bacterium]|nr:hypothetical protein [bacterium]
MEIKSIIKEVCLDGGPGICLFALREKEAAEGIRNAGASETERALKILRENGIRQVIFSGFRALDCPDGENIVKTAVGLGMSAGTAISLEEADAQKLLAWTEAGLSKIYIGMSSLLNSLDDREKFMAGCAETAAMLKAAGQADAVACVSLNRAIDPEAACAMLEQLGFKSALFDLDGIKIGSGAEADGSVHTVEEVLAMIDIAAAVKNNILINSPGYWRDMRGLFTGERQSFVCQGGYKLFFLDSRLQLRRCPQAGAALCAIEAFNGSQAVRDGCVACQNAFFRNYSIGLQSLTSFSDGLHSLCFNQRSRAAKQWLDLRNAESLKFVFKNMKNL